jgi:hypothetical protein
MPKHPGQPGDEIVVDQKLAQSWEARGGCVILADEPAKAARKSAEVGDETEPKEPKEPKAPKEPKEPKAPAEKK